MVLRHAALFALALWVTACIRPEAKGPVGTRLQVVGHLVIEDARGQRVNPPPTWRAEIDQQLADRGIVATWTEAQDADLTERRSTQARQRYFGGRSVHSDHLLIEGSVRFYNEVEGRFRWTVSIKASFFPGPAIDKAMETRFDAPAILNFPHQGAADALQYAAAPVAHEIAELGALYLDTRSAPGP